MVSVIPEMCQAVSSGFRMFQGYSKSIPVIHGVSGLYQDTSKGFREFSWHPLAFRGFLMHSGRFKGVSGTFKEVSRVIHGVSGVLWVFHGVSAGS